MTKELHEIPRRHFLCLLIDVVTDLSHHFNSIKILTHRLLPLAVNESDGHESSCVLLPRELRPDPLACVAGPVEAEERVGGAVFEEDSGSVLAEGRAELAAVA